MKVRELRGLLFEAKDQDAEVMISSEPLGHYNDLSLIDSASVMSEGDDPDHSECSGFVIFVGETVPRTKNWPEESK
jgi:hypothetical protein